MEFSLKSVSDRTIDSLLENKAVKQAYDEIQELIFEAACQGKTMIKVRPNVSFAKIQNVWQDICTILRLKGFRIRNAHWSEFYNTIYWDGE